MDYYNIKNSNMKKLLYFDCFSGISGDMAVAAMLDLGIDNNEFSKRLASLGLSDEFDIKIRKLKKHGITGTDFDVILDEKVHEHSHANDAFHGRNLKDIVSIIQSGGLSEKSVEFAVNAFNDIASAEAAVHGVDISEVHFHEVGAVDSIIDIVGAAILIDMIDADVIMSSTLREGSGTVETCHGMLPVPVPAVAKMLLGTGIPIETGYANTELVTPTGLAILKQAATSYAPMPAAVINSVGYGFGKKDIGKLNALRVVIANLYDNTDKIDEVAVIETNIDDCNPELIGNTVEKLFGSGALDVWLTPVHMKKNRPGTVLSVMCRDDRVKALAGIILSETASIGVRINKMSRMILSRQSIKVDTRFGEITVKTASGHGIFKGAPEFESCRKAASEYNVPVKEVYEEAIAAYRKYKTKKI